MKLIFGDAVEGKPEPLKGNKATPAVRFDLIENNRRSKQEGVPHPGQTAIPVAEDRLQEKHPHCSNQEVLFLFSLKSKPVWH